ncbi:MAG: hypothetical protein AW10_01944 [Candidatus Accumulibacter appositus]|uniref:Uncharacterized protein n=1 Tax=Candidatus Accumulibacter appositus TaxID=1454003 RepID=A0A011PSZ7_9PROT|nr:MAG: hypothetical protein AW10_01944 [Candidatus Accumulibacter appositus]
MPPIGDVEHCAWPVCYSACQMAIANLLLWRLGPCSAVLWADSQPTFTEAAARHYRSDELRRLPFDLRDAVRFYPAARP